MPKISVLIQSHNRPEGLQRALMSLGMQTTHDFEVIVSDDSEDYGIVSALCDDWGFDVKLKHTEPCGAAESMREAFSRSSGEYIKILHDDDWLTPHSLEVMAHTLDQRPDVNAVYGQALIQYPMGDKLFYTFSENAVEVPSEKWVSFYAENGFGPVQSPVCAMYRRHDKFRVTWDEYINPELREAARKTGAGTDINLQVDNAGSNKAVILLPFVVAVLCTDMQSTTQTDPKIQSYYKMWAEEYATNPPWKLHQ